MHGLHAVLLFLSMAMTSALLLANMASLDGWM